MLGGWEVGAAWGTQNRETPLRKIAGSHWEVKCLDGLANMYLAMAAIIGAGARGVALRPDLSWKDCGKDPATLSEEEKKELGITKGFPTTLEEALEELEEDDVLEDVLQKEVVARYIAVKKAEMGLLNGLGADEMREWLIERY